VIKRLALYGTVSWTKNRLGDNAAARTAGSSVIGVDRGGGCGLSLRDVGGGREEGSEEIH
jgi:hypothetical protein